MYIAFNDLMRHSVENRYYAMQIEHLPEKEEEKEKDEDK